MKSLNPPRARQRIHSSRFAILVAVPVVASALLTVLVHAQQERYYERVLAIGGAVTEIVFALGEQDRLVGRDSTSMYPAEALALPDVGYIRALSPEGVLSVEPDLILARENNGPAEAVEVLKRSGVRWVDVPDNFTVEGIDDNIRIIADALGVPDKGDALRQKVRSELDAVAERIAAIGSRRKAMFILTMRDNRVMAAGKDTGADGILTLAGAENVITEFDGYKQVSDEAVIDAAPEVIVMMQGRAEIGDHASTNATLESHPALASTPAVKNGDIVRVDGLLMLGFGPRTGEAALRLARAIYPDEFDARR
jgi:iron complex transport system substrate-binding protein